MDELLKINPLFKLPVFVNFKLKAEDIFKTENIKWPAEIKKAESPFQFTGTPKKY